MKRLAIYLLALLPLGIVVTLAYAQIRSDTLFPWASGLAIPGLQIGIQGPNPLAGTPMQFMRHGTVAIDVANMAGAGTCALGQGTVTGIAAADTVVATLADNIGDTGVNCAPDGITANTINVRCCKETAGAFDPAGTVEWAYVWIRP